MEPGGRAAAGSSAAFTASRRDPCSAPSSAEDDSAMLTSVVGDSDGGDTVSGAAPVSFSVGETDMTPPIDATTCRRMSYNYVFSTFDTRPIANRAVQRGMPAAGRVRSAAPPEIGRAHV